MRVRRPASVMGAAVLALGVSLLSVPTATGYPPGTAMTVSAASPAVQVGAYATLTASNVKPGCRVSFIASGAPTRFATANGGGVAAAQFRFGRIGSTLVRAYTSNEGGCGTEKAFTTVNVYGAPSAPSSLRAAVSSTTVSASWRSPCSCGGLPLLQWNVRLTTSAGTTVAGPFTTTSPSYTFSGLTRSTYYYIVVSATNTASLTGPSSALRVKTSR